MASIFSTTFHTSFSDYGGLQPLWLWPINDLTKTLILFLWIDTLLVTKMATKWLKSILYLWPKRLKNPTVWGRTYLYIPYKGVPPAGFGDPHFFLRWRRKNVPPSGLWRKSVMDSGFVTDNSFKKLSLSFWNFLMVVLIVCFAFETILDFFSVYCVSLAFVYLGRLLVQVLFWPEGDFIHRGSLLRSW